MPGVELLGDVGFPIHFGWIIEDDEMIDRSHKKSRTENKRDWGVELESVPVPVPVLVLVPLWVEPSKLNLVWLGQINNQPPLKYDWPGYLFGLLLINNSYH